MQDPIRYHRNPDFIFRTIVDELVLVPIRQNAADMDAIYTMNPVGAFIWERLADEATVSDLQAAVLAQYEAEPEVVSADLMAFLAEMRAIGAVLEV